MVAPPQEGLGFPVPVGGKGRGDPGQLEAEGGQGNHGANQYFAGCQGSVENFLNRSELIFQDIDKNDGIYTDAHYRQPRRSSKY